jgi:hypothetical protein
MSETWFVYADLDAPAALAVAAAADEAIAAWLADHEGGDEDSVPELGGGGPVPRQPEVAAAYRRYRLDLPDAVIERLASCRATLAVDHPGALPESPLSVSVLRFVLARVGPALVMFNDYPLVLSEEVLRGLGRRRGARGFEEAGPAAGRRSVKRRAARAGEVRAIRVHAALQRAMGDPELGVDVRAALWGLPIWRGGGRRC